MNGMSNPHPEAPRVSSWKADRAAAGWTALEKERGFYPSPLSELSEGTGAQPLTGTRQRAGQIGVSRS